MPTVWRTSFSIPLRMRRDAATKAAADGLSLASAVRMLLAGYVSGRIAIVAAPASSAVTVERVEETPMSAGTRKLAHRVFAGIREHDRR